MCDGVIGGGGDASTVGCDTNPGLNINATVVVIGLAWFSGCTVDNPQSTKEVKQGRQGVGVGGVRAGPRLLT